MAKDTRRIILENSYELFARQGYSATSMRQIADACGIQLGNLSYYFKKKEDLFMYFYKELFTVVSFHLTGLLDDDLDPWTSYIVKEYYFLYKCAFDLKYRNSFVDAINIPSLRREYIRLHHERFLETFRKENQQLNEQDVYISSIIVSAAEFQLMDTFAEQSAGMGFDDLFTSVFRVRMDLLGVPDALQEQLIEKGIGISKEIFAQNPSLIDM